jgi:hypothetical protein
MNKAKIRIENRMWKAKKFVLTLSHEVNPCEKELNVKTNPILL